MSHTEKHMEQQKLKLHKSQLHYNYIPLANNKTFSPDFILENNIKVLITYVGIRITISSSHKSKEPTAASHTLVVPSSDAALPPSTKKKKEQELILVPL